jgi:hypothetical protein
VSIIATRARLSLRRRLVLKDRAHVELRGFLRLQQPRRAFGGRRFVSSGRGRTGIGAISVDRGPVKRVLLGRQILHDRLLRGVVKSLSRRRRRRYGIERVSLLARNLRGIGSPASLQLQVFADGLVEQSHRRLQTILRTRYRGLGTRLVGPRSAPIRAAVGL